MKKPAQADKMFGFEDWRVVSKAPLKVGQLDGVEVLGQAKGPTVPSFGIPHICCIRMVSGSA